MTPDRHADADIPLPRLRTITHLWSCAAVLAALGVAALAIDVPVAHWARSGACPGWVHKICSLCELFSHGLGVACIVIAIAVLDPWHRYAIPRIMAAGLGSGLAANALKLLVARVRPNHGELAASGLETFVDWLPLASNPSWQQSFPSSHTATAAGMAIVLAAFYPRGRWLFPAIAVGAAAQRVIGPAHFVSDAFWGAAVGCIVAPLCMYGGRLSTAFDRLEEYLISRNDRRATGRVRKPFVAQPAGVISKRAG